MRNITRIIPILMIIACAIASIVPADAGAYLYSNKRKQINCGVIRLPSDTNDPLDYASNQKPELYSGYSTDGIPGLGNGAGNLFYLIDSLTSMKPAGWTLENPFAGITTISGQIRKYSKTDPEYWLVDLSAARDLSRMQVLYFPAHGMVSLNDDDREKLRRFVDGGGVLWVDNSGTSANVFKFGPSSAAGTFFISNFEFSQATGADYITVRHHPLLTIPYWLTDQDVSILGSNAGQCCVWPGFKGSGTFTSAPDRFEFLFPVTKNSGIDTPPSVASNAYGGGYVVATSNYVGRGCFMNYPYNLPSLKFAYNVLTLSSSWNNPRKDPRHSGCSIDTVGGTKLAKMWTYQIPNSTEMESAPVIYKNVVFYSNGSTLYAFDLKPQEDLDGDGTIDDGELDMDTKETTGQDLIWKYDCDGTLSSPVVVTAQDPASPSDPGKSVDAVLVASTNGTVYMLNAFPQSSSGQFLATSESLLYNKANWYTGATCPKPYPPLYINGWIYTAGQSSSGSTAGAGVHIYALNPVLQYYYGASSSHVTDWSWEFPPSGTSIAYTGPELKSGLCFGFASSQDSGALTGILYWSTNPNVALSTQNDIVFGLPLFVKNDHLKTKKIQGTQAECQSTISPAVIGKLTNIWCKNYSSSEISLDLPAAQSSINKGFGAAVRPGYILVTASGSALTANNGEIPGDAIICADYTLEYSSAIISVPKIKLSLDPESPASSGLPVTSVTATPALGRDAMVYIGGKRDVTTSSPLVPGGSIYGIQLDPSTQMNKWNYFLHAGLTRSDLQNASGSASDELSNIYGPISDMVIPGVVMKQEGSAWYPLQNAQPLSSPAYAGDKVFVTVSGTYTDGTSGGALLCMKAHPDFVIRITENAGYNSAGITVRKAKSLYDVTNNRKRSVSIWQPNLLDNSTTPLSLLNGQVGVPSSMIDYDKGTITIDNFSIIKLRSSGLSSNTLSPSLPVWVMLDGAIEVPIDFSTWGPLSAYSTASQSIKGDAVDLSGWNNLLWYYPVNANVHSSPVVIGDVVYFTDDNGTIYAINTQTGETQGKPVSESQVIWKESSTNTSASGNTNFSIAGSNGVLMIPKADGLCAYSNTTTLVADTNRLMELDGAGEMSWAADSITWPAHIPPSVNKQPATTTGPINKPSRVRYVDSGEMLLTNSGANQVCRIDKSARVGSTFVDTTDGSQVYIRWLYDNFSDPKRLLRPGQPTSLNGPTDAILWQETENVTSGTDTNSYQVVHCLVADSGNHRIVDLTYKFKQVNNKYLLLANSETDPNTGFYLPTLNWVTTTDTANQNYVFDCLQLVSGTSGSNKTTDVWAAISNFRTGTGETAVNQGLGGAIVGIRYRVSNGSAWNYSTNDSGRIVYGCDKMNFSGVGGQSSAPLATPRYFQVVDVRHDRYLYVCDNYGVYKAQVPASASTLPDVTEMLNYADYAGMDRAFYDNNGDGNDDTGDQSLKVPLRASCVHVLPNGNWLITNSYSGISTDGTNGFSGEVFEYNPTNKKIEWHSPDITFTPDLESLSGAPSYTWKQTIKNGQIMHQPACAYRQF